MADPTTENRYQYADGDPANLVDPTGHGSLANAFLGTAVHSFLNRAFESFTATAALVPGLISIGLNPVPRYAAGPGISGSIQRWSNRYISSIAARYGSPGSTNSRRPDFVEVNTATAPFTGDLYELKAITRSTPNLSTSAMVAGLAFYYIQLLVSVPNVSWGLGTTWIPGLTIWPTFTSRWKPADSVLITIDGYSLLPGAIFYDVVGEDDEAELEAAAGAGWRL